ncbi:hypothetical protein AMTR_s00046p00178970 [Amborella trichopoda]|uniref:Uncharacterized protein n=1 Tax=Amborella trichopoda TaxID=13333 RepID=U5D6H7_AMBTC|nr:hypothetical protein AMTR_s00046p00178970 [Amborella trichopoda]
MIHETPTTNNLQFMHNTGLGRELRSNDSQNMFNASMIHETPTITRPTLPKSIKVPPTLHIPPPTLAIPNFEVPTNGTHRYSYPYLGYGKRFESNHSSGYHITHPDSGAHATYGGSRTHSSFLDHAGYDHMSYESGALTAYTSGAHHAGCSGEPSNYENGFMQSYHRTEEGNMGYSMIGCRGKFYGDNVAHTIYTNGANQADYSGAPGNNEWSPINNGNHFTLKDLRVEEGNKGLLYSQNPMIGSCGDQSSQNPMIGSSGDLNPVIPLFENGSMDVEFVEGGSFGFPLNNSLDDICSRMLYDQDEDFKIM